ncbi:hypothetical protein AAY473_009810 [Plecturocebus cupreus]
MSGHEKVAQPWWRPCCTGPPLPFSYRYTSRMTSSDQGNKKPGFDHGPPNPPCPYCSWLAIIAPRGKA